MMTDCSKLILTFLLVLHLAACAAADDAPATSDADGEEIIADGDEEGESVAEEEEAEDEAEAECSDCNIPLIVVEPRMLNFGMVCFGQTAVRTFTIRNDGNRSFELYDIVFSEASSRDYHWYGDKPQTRIQFLPGDSATFDVALTQSDEGVDIGTLEIVTDYFSPDSGYLTISLGSWYGGETRIEVSPKYYQFGPVEVGESELLQITVTNKLPHGEPPQDYCKSLKIEGIDFDTEASAHYRFAEFMEMPTYILPGQTFEFGVYYAPLMPSNSTADVVISHDADINPYSDGDPHQPVRVHLEGLGVVPKLAIEPNPVNFGDVAIDNEATKVIKIMSLGGASVRLCGIEWRDPVPSAFSLNIPDGVANAVIPPQSEATFEMKFLPQQNTYFSALLKICSNDVEVPSMIIEVSGRGVNGMR